MIKAKILFAIKKIVSLFLSPLLIILVLLISGLVLLWRKKNRAGRTLITAGTGLLILLSCTPISTWLIANLERQHPSIRLKGSEPSIPWIVVLSGGVANDPDRTAIEKLSRVTLARLAEGVRIQRQIPESKLLLSGGSGLQAIAAASEMATAAQYMGVPGSRIVLESGSRDTREQALLIKKIVGQDPFILVTSALHMVRALGMFRKIGLDPIPAPTDFVVRKGIPWHLYLAPSVGGIGRAEMAVHEYAGILWAKLRRQM